MVSMGEPAPRPSTFTFCINFNVIRVAKVVHGLGGNAVKRQNADYPDADDEVADFETVLTA
jgi:hypothetical protein